MDDRINFELDEKLKVSFKEKLARKKLTMREVLEAFISKWVKKKESGNV